MGLLLCVSVGVLTLAGGYRWLWRRRYGPTGVEGHYLRVTGRVTGPGETGRVVYRQNARGEALHCEPFQLETAAGQCHEVDPGGSQVALYGGRVRVGDTVVVDATHGAVHVDEALYRDAALRPALSALRLVRGAWPELRWLRSVMGSAAIAAATLALLAPTPPPRPARGALACPTGTRAGGARGKTQWCEEDRGREAVVGGQDAIVHGPFVVWWDRQQMRQKGQYDVGRAEGRWVTWHRDGRVAVEARYARGERVGSWKTWRSDGSLREQGAYDGKGRRHGAWRNFHADGRLALLRSYRHGKRHGSWIKWSSAGQLIYQQAFDRNRLHGKWRLWNAEGTLVEAGHYRQGKKHGRWAAWFPSGQLVRQGSYHDGRLHGPRADWHETGQLKRMGSYRQGHPDGRWTLWDENGQVAARGSHAATTRPPRPTAISRRQPD